MVQGLKPGDRFLHFTIVRLLGEGGMGQVFEAEHELTRRRTALKVALAKLTDADMQARMIQEACSLAELDHPNIVRLYDANLTPDGRLWLAMEFLEGRSLRAYRTTAGPLPVAQALHILIEICDGVAAAHEIGIIHRDLKPENVQLTPQNVAKVLDFGAAKVTRGASTRSTLVGPGGKRILGTPAYMSPEHLRGARVDPRTDSYAIGTIGIELLWAHPFSNPDGSMPETYEMVRRQFVEPPVHLRDVALHVPLGVADLLDRALAKDPEDRPGVAELAAGLRVERAKYKATHPEADSEPFAREWTGPGSWASHGPAVSLPRHAPPPVDPSRSVVVQGAAPASPAAVPSPKAVPSSGAVAGKTPMSPPVIAGDAPRSHALPVFQSTVEIPATPQRSSAPPAVATVDLRPTRPPSVPDRIPAAIPVMAPSAPPAMTMVPATVGPEQRASHPAQVRAQRIRVLVFLAACCVGVVGGALYFLRGVSPYAEGRGTGSAPVLPAAPPAGDPSRASAPEAGAAGDPAGPISATPPDPGPGALPAGDPGPDAGTSAAPAGDASAGGPARTRPPGPARSSTPAAGSKPSTLDLPFANRPSK